MNKFICIIVFTSLLLAVAHAQPIIINDTGAWHGGMIAIRNFNLETDNNFWKQNGSNTNTHIIRTAFNIYEDGYSPVITNVGNNKVFAIYQLYDGTIIKDCTEFETSHLKVSNEEVKYLGKQDLYVVNLIPLTSGLEFPSDGIIECGPRHVSFPRNEYIASVSTILGIENLCFSVSSISLAIFAAFPAAAPVVGTASIVEAIFAAICDGIVRTINFVNTYDYTYFYRAYYPENLRPTASELFKVTAFYRIDDYKQDFKIYNDLDDWDGFVPDRSTITVALPFSKEIGVKYELSIIRE